MEIVIEELLERINKLLARVEKVEQDIQLSKQWISKLIRPFRKQKVEFLVKDPSYPNFALCYHEGTFEETTEDLLFFSICRDARGHKKSFTLDQVAAWRPMMSDIKSTENMINVSCSCGNPLTLTDINLRKND